MWFRVDDSFQGHPKAIGISNDSLATWTRAGEWCAWQLTDGIFELARVPMFAGDAGEPDAVCRDLLDRRLWEPAPDRPGCLQFHDWTDWNPSREKVMARRKSDRDRYQAWNEKRKANAGTNAVSDAVSDPVSNDVVSAASPTATRPDPKGRVGVQVGDHHQDRNARPRDDDDSNDSNSAGYLLDTVIIDAYRNHATQARTITREQAGAVRARLPGWRRAEHPDAYLVKVIMNDPNPGRLVPSAAPQPPPPDDAARARAQELRDGIPAEELARRQEVAQDGADAARKALANRERPVVPEAPGTAGLSGEALARSQVAASRAGRGAPVAVADEEPPPDEPDDDEEYPF